jgi:hypothetical protein
MKARPTAENVRTAFAEAEAQLDRVWVLKGRERGRRVTLLSYYSRPASEGATRSFDWLATGAYVRARIFPFELVARAARLLRVPTTSLICRER